MVRKNVFKVGEKLKLNCGYIIQRGLPKEIERAVELIRSKAKGEPSKGYKGS